MPYSSLYNLQYVHNPQGHLTNFAHIGHKWVLLCENSCIVFSLAPEELCQVWQKTSDDVIRVTSAWVWKVHMFNREPLRQTGGVANERRSNKTTSLLV